MQKNEDILIYEVSKVTFVVNINDIGDSSWKYSFLQKRTMLKRIEEIFILSIISTVLGF